MPFFLVLSMILLLIANVCLNCFRYLFLTGEDIMSIPCFKVHFSADHIANFDICSLFDTPF